MSRTCWHSRMKSFLTKFDKRITMVNRLLVSAPLKMVQHHVSRGRAKKSVHVMAHGFMNDSTQHFVLYVSNLTHLGTCTSHSFVHILKQTITESQSMFVLECWV